MANNLGPPPRSEISVEIQSRASLPGALRLCLAIAGVCALVFGALWAAAVFQALFFDADHFIFGNGLNGYERRSIGILGFLGVLASGAAGGSAIAYARTTEPRWLVGMALGILYGVLLLVVWIAIYEVASGSK